MKAQEQRLTKLTTSEVRRNSATFIEIGQMHAEKHAVLSQKRTIAWGLVTKYLLTEYAAMIERMDEQGWTQAQHKARSVAVDIVMQGFAAAQPMVAA